MEKLEENTSYFYIYKFKETESTACCYSSHGNFQILKVGAMAVAYTEWGSKGLSGCRKYQRGRVLFMQVSNFNFNYFFTKYMHRCKTTIPQWGTCEAHFARLG